jgi:3-oxoacyl-[acyl-carrier protein] reductase
MKSGMRNVIVTGGSRGLGLAIARHLAGEGYRVIAIARKANSPLTEAIAEVEKAQIDKAVPGKCNGSMHFIPYDLAEIEKLPALVRQVHQEFGPIHGLVNNAALGTSGALAMMPNAQIAQLIRLNTLSPIVLTKYVVRNMMADGGGRIVNVASITAFTGYSGLSVYAATKSSMIGFTRSLAREVGSMGVNVNAVAPGFMDTDMTEGMDSKRREQILRRSALGRFPGVEDVAVSVAFLLGDQAKNITGTVLTVDAGATA